MIQIRQERKSAQSKKLNKNEYIYINMKYKIKLNSNKIRKKSLFYSIFNALNNIFFKSNIRQSMKIQ